MSDHLPPRPGRPSAGRCPARPIVLHGPEFAADPAAVYRRARAFGPAAPVELAPGVPATLVTSYHAVRHVLNSPQFYIKSPRTFEELTPLPEDSPVRSMMMDRPNALHADAHVHARLRGALVDSLDQIDPALLRRCVARSAATLIAEIQPVGRADLLTQYAARIPLLVFQDLFGCPPQLGARMRAAMAAIFDGRDPESANAAVTGALRDLIALKLTEPAADVTTMLIRHHSRLGTEELIHQLVLLMGAGTEPELNLIANTLRLLLTDDRFAGDVGGGTLPVQDALDEVLWLDPPMANFGITYPVRDVDIGGLRVAAHTPVVASYAAANTDPALSTAHRHGNRSHLAFSIGPHKCPAQRHARLIAVVAIETLLDHIPEITLAVPAEQLRFRPGPFHRALMSLPVTFPPTTAPAVIDDTRGASPWTPQPNLLRSPSTPPAVTSTAKPLSSAPAGPPHAWNSPAGWWSGR